MTNCSDIRVQLPLLLYGELSFDEEETVESHLDVCPECRASLERERELSAAFHQVAVEPSPALLRECRENLFVRIQAEGASEHQATHSTGEPTQSWWVRFVESITIPVALRPAGAVALLAMGFFGARMAPNVLPGGGTGSIMAGLGDFGGARVRSVQPGSDGIVRIVLDETRQRTVDGRMDDREIRELLLEATRDPSDGLRAETVALLTTRPQAEDVRDALVYTIRNDRNAAVRLKALEGLQSFIGEPDVRGALADVLASDANPAMRLSAIDLLMQGLDNGQTQATQVVDPRMIGVLQELTLHKENPYMREKAQKALELVKASAEVF
jgi:hypothetical protein